MFFKVNIIGPLSLFFILSVCLYLTFTEQGVICTERKRTLTLAIRNLIKINYLHMYTCKQREINTSFLIASTRSYISFIFRMSGDGSTMCIIQEVLTTESECKVLIKKYMTIILVISKEFIFLVFFSMNGMTTFFVFLVFLS